MLTAEVNSLKYNRVLTDNFDEYESSELRNDFDYSFVISYGDFKTDVYDVIDKHAVVIDLNNDIEEIFSKFNATARKHIRRFNKLDELSFSDQIFDKREFYKFYCKCEASRGWLPVPQQELFKSIIFYVTYKGSPISGISAYTSNNKIRMGRIFSIRNIATIENSNLIFGVAAKKLVYEFCKYGIKNKFEQLDLGGIDLKSSEKSGISEFKLAFSNKIIPVKIGRYVSPPNTYVELQKKLFNLGIDLT